MRYPLALLFFAIIGQAGFAQSSVASFLTNVPESDFFEKLPDQFSTDKDWDLDFSKLASLQAGNYNSGVQVFSPISPRFQPYPSRDLSRNSELILGNYSVQDGNIGNLKFNTTYIFDITGRLVDYQTNFKIGK